MNDPSFGKGHSSLLIPQATYLGVESLGGCPPPTDVSSDQTFIGAGNSTARFSPGPNNKQHDLGKLQLIELEDKLAFAIQVFC